MGEIVPAYGGTVDKYIGDAMMALWNAPLPDPLHREHAARAALAMLDALPGLRTELSADGLGLPPIRRGIGLARCRCLGLKRRHDYAR